MPFCSAPDIIPPRWACSPGLSGSFVINQSLIVPARSFLKDSILFNWVTPANGLAYTFLYVVRFSPL